MELLERIQQAGIVGAGGAGFPTQIKLDCRPDVIIVNGAECEPLLRVDQQLMARFAGPLTQALELVRQEKGAGRAVFALKGKYHRAMEALGEAAASYPQIEVFELDNFYPAGDEQITVYEVTGRIMPEGAIPISVGVVVLNVETLLNIYYAVQDKPVTEKYLTVTGEVNHPCTLKLPLGVSYGEAIELAGGSRVGDAALIDGGPMMGRYNEDLDTPITKTSKGIIVLSRSHPWIREKNKTVSAILKEARTCCCHCMLCTEVCPRHLLGHELNPDRLMRLASYGSACTADEELTSAFLCCECGACGIGCVMGLQPYKLNGELKRKLAAAGIKNPHHKQPEKTDRFRESKKMSIQTILGRTGLKAYDVPAPLTEKEYAPKRVRLPLKQHIGAPSRPVVEKGQRVKAGEVIAIPAEKGPGAYCHASIDGRIEALENGAIVIERG